MNQMQLADSSSSSIALFTDTDSYPPLAMEAGLCFFEIGSIDDERLRVSEVTNELHQIVDGENSYQRQISVDACLTEEEYWDCFHQTVWNDGGINRHNANASPVMNSHSRNRLHYANQQLRVTQNTSKFRLKSVCEINESEQLTSNDDFKSAKSANKQPADNSKSKSQESSELLHANDHSRETKVTRRSKSAFNKKAVSFADTCGRQLLHILLFEKFQECDFTVIDACEDFEAFSLPSCEIENFSFAPLFFLPPSSDLLENARSQNVKLETVQIIGLKILGSVLVTNLSYRKDITIRYSLNNWEDFNDLKANYESGSPNEDCERFSFEVEFENWQIEDGVSFCIRYRCDIGEFWDNNNGFNYTLKLLEH